MRNLRSQLDRSFHRGFTLLELLVVVTVVAIVGKIALPRYANAVANARLNAALNRITADINMARSQAMTTSAPITISFNSNANTYTISGIKSLDNRSANYTVNLGSDPYYADLTSVSFGASLQSVTFDAYGVPDNSGLFTIYAGKAYKSISIEATTGKVSVQ
jgi:prepilin-type N-terminal cleavage/methylation domain-containing protein